MGLFSSLQAFLLLHCPLVFTTSDIIKSGKNYTTAYENITLLCKKEKVRPGSCLVNRLRCYYRKDCREYILMKLICSVSSNQSSHAHDYPDCQEGGNEASLLVSPLVVAGIVIGLVLFLSCITIIVGSLRKDRHLHNPHLRASYAPDSLSYGGSIGELRSTCIEEFPPPFDSYVETLSQINIMYPDSPPHYNECVGPGTQLYVPTDDPPAYSLTDPCREQAAPHNYREMEALPAGASWVSASCSSRYSTRLQDLRHQPVASISLSALPLEEAPPYEAVVSEQNQPLPLMPLDLLKHTAEDSSLQDIVTHRIW
ncbi:protein BEAN1-like isoform X1 [Xyrauchen texanus]|uniref:protein BEAN1-like isoform X1 n=1 Tax=Xyrauchen texanus TaxID=154827 RepID=UPI002241C648|nr:protein BEAN1-like isoform X1 [Xyrauchen texanus]